MKLKTILTSVMLTAMMAVSAQDVTSQRMFPYPEPPEELETLSERTSYLVDRFWERCNLSSAIQRRDEFKNAFIDYVSFMPYADADVVHKSIDRLIAKFEKEPANLLTLGLIAEETLYDPEGEYQSDEIYLPFAEAVAKNKKIKSAEKARFAYQAKILRQTQVGMTAPEINFVRVDGSKGKLSDYTGTHTLILFNDPMCYDCYMARVRLSADPNINDLIEDGRLTLMCIYPNEPDDLWLQQAADYNKRWVVGASGGIDEVYDMRIQPVLYYLNPQGKILSKSLEVDNLLEAFRRANNYYKNSDSQE